MQSTIHKNESLLRAGLLGFVLLNCLLWGQNLRDRTNESADSHGATDGEVRIPNRAATSLFKGEQGKQRTEIHFDPATGMVTIKLLVQDPNGYFIPNIRRDNFVVYENGVRQQIATVEVEHAPVSLGLLMECGGRHPSLNKDLVEEATRVGHQLLEVLGRDDKIAIWKYADAVEQVAAFTPVTETLDSLFYKIAAPGVSEANLYDALITVLDRMKTVKGRRGVILVSSGVDTFSKATFEDALKTARDADTPVYVISLGPVLRRFAELNDAKGLIAGIDWKRVDRELQEIAKASGGRFYAPEETIDLSATYDDIIENLKVRYVIAYKSSTDADSNSPRTVRVELVNARTGDPLQIVDANGKTIRAKVIFQDTYTPRAVSGG